MVRGRGKRDRKGKKKEGEIPRNECRVTPELPMS